MKKMLAVLLCASVSVALYAADDGGYKVGYDGGSIAGVKAGSEIKLYMETDTIRLTKDKAEIAKIPASSVTEISYGQDVHRRVGAAVAVGLFTLGVGALLALSKSKKHFIGIIWDDNGKKGGFAMQCDKNDYRGVLAGLEGVTGKKAVDSETMNVKN
jgi:hypothetical protein